MIGKLSVLLLAALGVWLVLPDAEEPAPTRPEPADRQVRTPQPEVSAPGIASAPALAARPGGGAAAPIGPPRPAEEPAAERAPAAPAAAATREDELQPLASTARDDSAGWGNSVPAAPRTAALDLASPDRERDFAADPASAQPPAWVPVQRTALIQRSDVPVPDPVQVEQRVEREVPDGSLPPEQLEAARADARERITEEQQILDRLARNSAGEDAPERALRERRDIGSMLFEFQDAETRERIKKRTAAQINAQP